MRLVYILLIIRLLIFKKTHTPVAIIASCHAWPMLHTSSYTLGCAFCFTESLNPAHVMSAGLMKRGGVLCLKEMAVYLPCRGAYRYNLSRKWNQWAARKTHEGLKAQVYSIRSVSQMVEQLQKTTSQHTFQRRIRAGVCNLRLQSCTWLICPSPVTPCGFYNNQMENNISF